MAKRTTKMIEHKYLLEGPRELHEYIGWHGDSYMQQQLHAIVYAVQSSRTEYSKKVYLKFELPDDGVGYSLLEDLWNQIPRYVLVNSIMNSVRDYVVQVIDNARSN